MVRYKLYRKNPASHYIYIDMFAGNLSGKSQQLQLPAWRPGRYELGNFAKNIKRVDFFNEKGESLQYTKHSKDLWEVDLLGATSLKITYSYFAAELNAGSCYSDETQLYVNPVHCCMYLPGRMDEPHEIELDIPAGYKIASSLKTENNTLKAKDYDELADSPFIASGGIKSDRYEVNGIKFHLHFNGECRPDFTKIKKDFLAFTDHMIGFWKDFPYDEYHFLFQVLPFKFYHGVEHKKNTVIAIGPGFAINSGSTYEDVLGVSCHELFHTWNIKTIRPAEMLPYDFARENYARTGYVYEGFTTYYGDKLLLGSGVFNLAQYFETLQERLVKHFHNFGRYNLSVAQSSWETWLDGYVPGAPYRKTNIYDEGSLVAFMLDVMILKATSNKRSLRDVCLQLYERFGKKNTGYGEQDIISLVNETAGTDLTDFFKKYVYSPADFEEPLNECFLYLGFEMVKMPNTSPAEHFFGFKWAETATGGKVSLVAPYSPAWKAGLFAGDEIIAINGLMLKNNLNGWLQYFMSGEEILLSVNSADQLKTLNMQKDKKGMTWFFNPVVRQVNGNQNFEAWKAF